LATIILSALICFIGFVCLAWQNRYVESIIIFVLCILLTVVAIARIKEKRNPKAVQQGSSVYYKKSYTLNMDQFVLVESNSEHIIYTSKNGKYMFSNNLKNQGE